MCIMGRYFPLMFKNAWRNRRRTGLTILSVAASLCLLGVLLAMYHAFYFQQASPAQALRLITRNRVSLTFPIPIYYREKMRQIPGVRDVMISQWFGGVYKDSRDPNNFFARLAIEPERIFTIRSEMQMPEEQKLAFQRDRTGCLVGGDLARKLGFKLGDRITITGDIFPVTMEFVVRAIYEAPENNEVFYFHFKYLEESVSEGRRNYGVAGTFVTLADSPDSVPRIARAIDETFRGYDVQTKTESEQAFALSFLSFLGNVKAFLLSICAAVTFTILLVSANTMAMSVRERVHEIGILKTLGFTERGILGIVLGEAVMISVAGGVLGLVLAQMLCRVIRHGPAMFDQIKYLGITPVVGLACLMVAAVVGLLSSLIPAWGAARISIVQAIRSSN
jgi:putative ABC transport system permease protein